MNPEDITLFDLAEMNGLDPDWVIDEMLFALSVIGLAAIDEESEAGIKASSVTFTIPDVDDDGSDVEIIVRRASKKPKRILH